MFYKYGRVVIYYLGYGDDKLEAGRKVLDSAENYRIVAKSLLISLIFYIWHYSSYLGIFISSSILSS
jgi:hypothetical protein